MANRDEQAGLNYFDVYGLKQPVELAVGASTFHTSCRKCLIELEAESYDLLIKEQDDHGCPGETG